MDRYWLWRCRRIRRRLGAGDDAGAGDWAGTGDGSGDDGDIVSDMRRLLIFKKLVCSGCLAKSTRDSA